MSEQEVKELREELSQCQAKREEYLNGWKRAKADYINFKKETEKRQSEIIQFANAALIMELIPIYDHFKMAFLHIPEDQKSALWIKGIENIKSQFKEFLKNLGITEIKTVGEKFNPEFHEAVTKEKVEGKEPGVILEELKPGYLLHDKVLIPAKVKVAD